MTRDKKLLICLMIMQKVDLKPVTNQNKIKKQEHELKYEHLNKCFKDYQKLLHK